MAHIAAARTAFTHYAPRFLPPYERLSRGTPGLLDAPCCPLHPTATYERRGGYWLCRMCAERTEDGL